MDEFVKSIKNGLKESREFFGNKKKQERELWVLREFLSYVKPDFNENDLVISTCEPNDVFYGMYGFQVKEMLTPGRKRGAEYKSKLEAITDETKPKELLEAYTPTHIQLNNSLVYVVSELARHREEKYNNKTKDINVLVYLNLTDTTYTSDKVDNTNAEFRNWKSVSLVGNNCAITLACNDKNIKFLSSIVGKLHVKS